jgi:hypothetical protein
MPTKVRRLPPHWQSTQLRTATHSMRHHAPQHPPVPAPPNQTSHLHTRSQALEKRTSTDSQHPSESSHHATLFDNSTYQSPTPSSTSSNTSPVLAPWTQWHYQKHSANMLPLALQTAADTTSSALGRAPHELGVRHRRLRSLERSLSRG